MVTQLRLIECQRQDDPESVPFDDFWLLYPRREARKKALAAWQRIPADLHVEIIAALVCWRAVWRSYDDPRHIPHPATWLNGERWTDELPPGYAPPQRREQPRAEVAPRREMPQFVREALIDLKARMR